MNDCRDMNIEADLNAWNFNFQQFCEKHQLNFDRIQKLGIEKSKEILLKYFRININTDLTENEWNDLYYLMDLDGKWIDFRKQDILIKLLNSTYGKKIKNITKILVLGTDLNCEFIRLRKTYPKANFIVVDFKEDLVKKFSEKYAKSFDFSVDKLDLFNGRNLNDFALKHGKFDLIIVSKMYRFAPNNKLRYASVKFVYKHLLAYNGLFCVLESKSYSEYYNPVLLKKPKPMLNKTIKTSTKDHPIQFVIYTKELPFEVVS
ncbi:MAG: hypothetical protein JW891_00930 [Candidatus Lokiarchaeota archaeon]|nr:hypothetical protein [Candidatus Lokiarchaeota archaeon]